MIISNKDLDNLPVYTQSQIHLGKVSGYDLDADTGKIVTYYIKTGIIKDLLSQQLSVSSNQIVSIDRDKMIVNDSVKKQPVLDFESAKIATE